MEAKSRSQRWTYAEFARLPSEGSTRYEVVAGELVVTPAPSLRHQGVVRELITLLNPFVREHELGGLYPGPVDVLFGEGDYVEPDIVFVRRDHRQYLTDRGIEGPPDLIIEILSPSTAARDRGTKLERYRFFGVPEYWILDPDARSMEVWRLADGVREPETFGTADTLRWQPVPDEPALEVFVGALLPEE